MKFLLIASFAKSVILFRGSLIDALISKGMQVHIAAPDLPEGNAIRLQLEAKGLVVHDLPLHRTKMNPVADLRTLWHLWHLIRALRPQFVLGYTIKPVIYGSIAAWFARVPRRFVLITGLGYAFIQGRNQTARHRMLQSAIQWLYTFALQGSHKIFFQNPDDQALFRSLRILRPSAPSTVVNGSGVDLEQYQYTPSPVTTTPHFLLIARLLGNKGVREYAEAARCIRKRHPNTIFSLVGWLDENPDAIQQEELDQWLAEGTINYLGHLSDVRPAIAACSVYVLPSYREGTPRTVLEAMAMGRAVITSDAPGCRETVIDGNNGFLVTIKSVESLVAAMQRFIDDPILARNMGACSRHIAEQKYDVHKVNAVMLQEMGIFSDLDTTCLNAYSI